MLLLVRLASGERLRKATEAERRWFAACFLFVPILLSLLAYMLLSLIDPAHAAANWSFVTAGAAGLFLAVTQWPKYFTARASLIIGAVVWTMTLWLVL